MAVALLLIPRVESRMPIKVSSGQINIPKKHGNRQLKKRLKELRRKSIKHYIILFLGLVERFFSTSL